MNPGCNQIVFSVSISRRCGFTYEVLWLMFESVYPHRDIWRHYCVPFLFVKSHCSPVTHFAHPSRQGVALLFSTSEVNKSNMPYITRPNTVLPCSMQQRLIEPTVLAALCIALGTETGGWGSFLPLRPCGLTWRIKGQGTAPHNRVRSGSSCPHLPLGSFFRHFILLKSTSGWDYYRSVEKTG